MGDATQIAHRVNSDSSHISSTKIGSTYLIPLLYNIIYSKGLSKCWIVMSDVYSSRIAN